MNKKIEEAIMDLITSCDSEGGMRYDDLEREMPKCLAIIEGEMPKCDINKLWADGHIDDIAHIVLSSVIQPLPILPDDKPLSPQNPFPGNKPIQKFGFWK